MKHIIDLANPLYVRPSRKRRSGANPAQFLPTLIVSQTSAGLIVWDNWFLPDAFADKNLLVIQRQ